MAMEVHFHRPPPGRVAHPAPMAPVLWGPSSGYDCVEGTNCFSSLANYQFTDSDGTVKEWLRLSAADDKIHQINWRFDLTEDSHWVNGTLLDSADITLFLKDDNNDDSSPERARFTIKIADIVDPYFITDTTSRWDIVLGTSLASVITELQADGRMWVSLRATSGDFLFDKATLEACTAPVPEPATMLLLGTGLTGLAAARRKKKA